MSATPQQLSVPFNQLHVDDDNIRRDLPKIKELAEDIKERGQLQPIIVSNGGEGDHPYKVNDGFRRHAAMKLLGWTTKSVMIVVHDYKKGDVAGRLSDAWAANMQREGFSPLDQGEFIDKLLKGEYAEEEGKTAKKLTRQEVCQLLNMTNPYLGQLHKIFTHIDPDVAKIARKFNAPARLLIVISGIGENSSEEKRHELQMEKFDEWAKEQEQLAKTGRKRKTGPRKKKKGSDEPVGVVTEKQRVQHAAYVETREDGSERGFTVADTLKVLLHKQGLLAEERSREAAEQTLRLEGAIAGIEFMMGNREKIPGLNKTDFKILAQWAEEEKEAKAKEKEKEKAKAKKDKE